MSKRRAVFAGCGGITAAWMSAVEKFDDVEVVGLCDLDSDRIAAFEERWKVTPRAKGDDLERVIRESGADTVFDCTVPAAPSHAVPSAAQATAVTGRSAPGGPAGACQPSAVSSARPASLPTSRPASAASSDQTVDAANALG